MSDRSGICCLRSTIKHSGSSAFVVFGLICLLMAPTASGQFWEGSSTPGAIFYGGGIGIGTSTPSSTYLLDVNSPVGGRFFTTSPTGFGGLSVFGDADAYGNLLTLGSGRGDVYAGQAAANWSVFLTAGAASNGFIIQTYTPRPLVFGTNNAARVWIDASGNVGIGTTSPSTTLDVNGNVNVSGNIGAKYQDLAEWVVSEHPLEPGIVVVLNQNRIDQVVVSEASYDTTVAGVVSAQPGLILGVAGDDKSMIATTGRVRVKAEATRRPIRIGDLLVTSDISGHAMASEPVALAGIQMHRPGTIIGKALEPLSDGRGEILVLLSMQ